MFSIQILRYKIRIFFFRDFTNIFIFEVKTVSHLLSWTLLFDILKVAHKIIGKEELVSAE